MGNLNSKFSDLRGGWYDKSSRVSASRAPASRQRYFAKSIKLLYAAYFGALNTYSAAALQSIQKKVPIYVPDLAFGVLGVSPTEVARRTRPRR